MRWIKSGRVTLALHELRSGPGPTVLFLHGLAERSPSEVPRSLDKCAGPVWALDFVGHGDSDRAEGGGYDSEALLGDVDAALTALGRASLIGRGLGGYVAVLAAGCRPDRVTGALILDGPGLGGGGPERVIARPVASGYVGFDGDAADPIAVDELAAERRDPEYAAAFARHAGRTSSGPRLLVNATARPAWIEHLLRHGLAREMEIAEALDSMDAAHANRSTAGEEP